MEVACMLAQVPAEVSTPEHMQVYQPASFWPTVVDDPHLNVREALRSEAGYPLLLTKMHY